MLSLSSIEEASEETVSLLKGGEISTMTISIEKENEAEKDQVMNKEASTTKAFEDPEEKKTCLEVRNIGDVNATSLFDGLSRLCTIVEVAEATMSQVR